jgi:TolB-like protein
MIFEFGDCRLDAERRELRRSAELVAVEPQVFDLIHHLIRNRDRVISKDELLEAVWNGRIVSESTISSRVAAARHAIGDHSVDSRLIRTIARRGFRFVADVLELGAKPKLEADVGMAPSMREVRNLAHPARSTTIPAPNAADVLAQKPSLVVLPFANFSGDPAQEYFVDGMVEDITIALGRLPWLFVIGSIAAFAYKHRPVETRRLGEELGVRYVLSGSVRKDGRRVRIVAELTEAATGGFIWADRFESELESVFELQDRIAEHVSSVIAPALRNEEIARARSKPTENPTAYDLFLRALAAPTGSLDRNREALQFLRQAIDIDPAYSAAYGLAAWCHFWQKMVGWTRPDDPVLNEGIPLAHSAAESGENDSEAMWMAGQSLILLAGDYERALPLIERSISLNPNSPNAWWASAQARGYLGEADIALDHLEAALRLNPRDPWTYYYLMGKAFSLFAAGRFDEAAEAAEYPLQREPDFVPALRLKAAASGLLGRPNEGRAYLARLLAASPKVSLGSIAAFYQAPLARNPSCFDNYLKGLRLSGLAE